MGINTGAGFAVEMVKSGVNGEPFDPLKSLLSSGTAGVLSTNMSALRGTLPQGYTSVIGTSSGSPVDYINPMNMLTEASNAVIGTGTNMFADELDKVKMRSKRQESATLHKRVTPEWYYWSAAAIPGIFMIVLCINRAPEFGISVWLANVAVLIVCTTIIAFVTYKKSNTVSAFSIVTVIIGGGMALAGLSHALPVLGLAAGGLWTGCGVGMLIGISLSVGEMR
jgi:hypothetical protein